MAVLSIPITRAVDKTLRLLELTYQLALARWPLRAEQLQQTVIGYQALNGDPAALARTFERDKADLRTMGIPLETRAIGDDPADLGYQVVRHRLVLPAPTAEDAGWDALRAATPAFQATASALPDGESKRAAEAACALLPFAPDLGLTLPTLELPAPLRQRADHLVEWVHAMLLAVVEEGRKSKRPGYCVPVERVAEAVGMDPELVWHVAERGADRPPGHTTHARQKIRIEAPARDEGVVVMARLERPWRPRADHVEALLEMAGVIGADIPSDAASALRRFVRQS